MDPRYSVDISSPITPLTKSEQESQGLLPSPPLSHVEEPIQAHRAQSLGIWRRVLNPFLVLLALLSTLLAVSGWALYWRSLPRLPLAGEINGLVPEFPVRPVLFEDDPLTTPDHKTVESANATHDYWVSYMPIGNGFMAVEHDDNHILAPPMVGKGQEYYSIAVFHQLHCLHSVMKSYNKLADDLILAKRGGLHDGAEEVHHPDLRRHTDHCFRYLRQTIVCCGDTALEGQNLKAKVADTDGTGATHLCKDFDMIKAWASERKMDDSHSI